MLLWEERKFANRCVYENTGPSANRKNGNFNVKFGGEKRCVCALACRPTCIVAALMSTHERRQAYGKVDSGHKGACSEMTNWGSGGAVSPQRGTRVLCNYFSNILAEMSGQTRKQKEMEAEWEVGGLCERRSEREGTVSRGGGVRPSCMEATRSVIQDKEEVE